ncbi:MAG: hypothetical protein AB1714_16070 [Acidobacteriota bacterium]
MFNLRMRKFRFDIFWVQSCLDLLNSEALSEFGRQVLDKDSYGSRGGRQNAIGLDPMGRRFRLSRTIRGRVKKPHQFWASYYAQVLPLKGNWFGLAPHRVVFQDADLIRMNQDHISSLGLDGLQAARVFPSAYLCPTGWSVGLNVDLEGDLEFSQIAASSARLTSHDAKPFLFKSQPASLEFVLRGMSAAISGALLLQDKDYSQFRPYLVASPVRYAGQPEHFLRLESEEIEAILTLLRRKPTTAEQPFAPMFTDDSFGVTVFNYGTFLLTSRQGLPASCWLSNMKNAMMMAAMITDFCRSSEINKNRQIIEMRTHLVETLQALLKAYDTPHFGKVCRRHSAVDGLLRPAKQAARDQHVAVEANRFISGVVGLVPGERDWKRYQDLVASILPFLFEEWVHTSPQAETLDGQDKPDLVALVEADKGFWSRIANTYGPIVVVEIKNTHTLTKAHFEQLSHYLDGPQRGLGILVKRGIRTPKERKLIDTFSGDKKMILVLGDADLLAMLELQRQGQTPRSFLRGLFFDVASTASLRERR